MKFSGDVGDVRDVLRNNRLDFGDLAHLWIYLRIFADYLYPETFLLCIYCMVQRVCTFSLKPG